MSVAFPIPRQVRRQDLVAVAGQTAFQPGVFRVYDPSDVRVRVKGASGRFSTITTGFGVALSGTAPAFPIVTFVAGRAANDVIRIEGARLANRTTDVTLAGILRAAPLEAELDRITITQQELRRDADEVSFGLDGLGGAVDAAASSAAGAAISAAAAAAVASPSQPGTIKGNLSAGVAMPADVSLVNLTLPGNPLGDEIAAKLAKMFTQVGAGAQARLITDRFKEGIVSLDDYKFAVDTGDSAPWQRAHDALGNRGGIIQLPARDLVWNTPCTISNPVWTRGMGWCENDVPALGGQGTRVIISSPAFTPFYMTDFTGRGARFGDFTLKQTQVPYGPGWSPTPYPPVFNCFNTFGSIIIENILCNSVCKLLLSDLSGRPTLNNIWGQFWNYLIDIDRCLDCPRITNIHAFPFAGTEQNSLSYAQANQNLIILKRADTLFADNIFQIFGNCAILFAKGVDAANNCTYRFKVGKIQSDCSRYGIYSTADTTGITGTIESLDVQGVQNQDISSASIPNSQGIHLEGTNHDIMIGSFATEFQASSGVFIGGSGNRVAIGNSLFRSWGRIDNAPALTVLNATPANTIRFGTLPKFVGTANANIVNGGTNAVIDGVGPLAYTAAVSATSGALTTATATAKYNRVGKQVTVNFNINIADNGTGAATLRINAPYPSDGTAVIGFAKQFAAPAKGLAVYSSNGGLSFDLVTADTNAYPGGTGQGITGSITYWTP